MEKCRLVVRGDVVLHDRILKDAQIAVRDDTIVGLLSGDEDVKAEEVLDARGKLVFPGIVDAHVHCYSYLGEGVTNATRSAIAGGVTSIVEMPFDADDPVVTGEILKKKIDVINREAMADVALLGTLAKNGDLSHVDDMVRLGICGMKLSLTESDPRRFPRISDDILYQAMPLFGHYGFPVGFHAENDEIVHGLTAKAKTAGQHSIREHGTTRPDICEYLEISKLLEFARFSGANLYLNHLTLPHTFDLIARSRKDGTRVTTETCPQYLLLCDDDAVRMGMRSKVNPPLRSSEAREGMWNLFLNGHVDVLASDHAPWPLSKKSSDDVFQNACGYPSIETVFPLLFSEAVVRRKASPTLLARCMSHNPARVYGLHGKGAIAPGMDADLTILDPTVTWTIHAEDLHAAAGWTPFEGWEVQGRVCATVLRGRMAYDGKQILTAPGQGAFIQGAWSHSS